MRIHPLAPLLTALLAAAACGPTQTGEPDAGTGDAGGVEDGGTTLEPICTDPTPVPCEDEAIQILDLKDTVASGLVGNTQQADGSFISIVEAMAGGAFNVKESYTYVTFEDDGLQKVEIDDWTALGSMDWDAGFRRYIARLNGGDSGPSCTGARRMPPGTTFDDVTEPQETTFLYDDDLTDTCELVPDGSGLPSSPATVLASYYTYDSCVQMTGNVYVIQLKSGRQVKLEVLGYYFPLDEQEACNAGGGMAGGTSAKWTLHWAFLN